MYEQSAGNPDLQAHLANRFEKRLRLDVSHRSADLDDNDIETFCRVPDPALDLVGNVGNDLYRAAEIVAAALLADNLGINAARGEVVLTGHAGPNHSFVLAEIEIRLGSIGRDEHLAVLERAHRARIHVDVWIHLDDVDIELSSFEDGPQRGGQNPLTEGRNHTTGDKDKMRH